ncbi:MAG TPA: TIGR00269 family protein, partial [Methanothermococcus okinawensis]|nr:TIGR00269 family protein [Methanothermococcus okinawensis]
KQGPLLPGEGKFVKRVKPLYETPEREIAAYAWAVSIDYTTEICPYAKGAITLYYKEVLNQLEERRPGTKIRFVRGFLKKRHLFEGDVEKWEVKECKICGMPSGGEVCSFCRIWGLKEPVNLTIK